MKSRLASLASALLALSLLAAAPVARAQATSDKWEFQAIVYGFFPSFGGSTRFPARSGGSSIDVSSDTLLDNLQFAFMGTLEARKGRFGLFTDFIYFDVSGDKSNTRDFSIGGREIPGSITADLDLDLKATVWTLAGEYLVSTAPSAPFFVLAGARMLDVEEKLSYNLSGDLGPFVGPGRSGNSDVSQTYWDAVVGVKGRFKFGNRGEWFVPLYADVGAGESKLTWQVFGGIGYQFSSWGSVLAGWRYLDYDFKSGSNIESLDANGPMIGVAFSW